MGADVLVVGAGPTGLALAAHLASFGVPTLVVDRAADRAHESRALAIQPRTLEVLASIGAPDHAISQRLVAAGNRMVRLQVHARGRVATVPMFGLDMADTAYPYLLILSQAQTERILAEHLATAGVEVRRQVTLTDLVPTADGVECALRGPEGRVETVHTRYVVGCDGAHSTVRRLAGIDFAGSTYPQTFALADLEADGVERGAAHAFLTGGGPLFFFPLEQPATWRLIAMRPRSTSDAAVPDTPTLADLQALVDAYTGGAVRLRDPVWMTNFRLHLRAATAYRAGRLLLAGDAAHIHSPAGAQGMNTGIQDATNLAWKLATVLRGGPDELLDTYEAERAPVGRWVLRLSDRAFTAATSTRAPVRFARTRIVPLLLPFAARLRRGRTAVLRAASQLDIGYRGSPLSTEGPGAPRRRPRAGDRLTDLASTGTPGWHLLCPAGVASGRALDRAALGPVTVHERPGGIVLVRPDGHIGYRSGPRGVDGLDAYIGRWLIPAPPDTRTPPPGSAPRTR